LVPEQVIAVAHQIIVGPEFVEVVHTGEVRYADRVFALAALKAESVSERLPVLINFLDASLVVGREDREPDDQARVDYMARAIIDQFFCRRGVAMVGISSLDAKPAATAALVRNIPFQVFERREQAVVWLANLS
jgi:hypothetical protein